MCDSVELLTTSLPFIKKMKRQKSQYDFLLNKLENEYDENKIANIERRIKNLKRENNEETERFLNCFPFKYHSFAEDLCEAYRITVPTLDFPKDNETRQWNPEKNLE